jgi:gliding motility-associated-like protein
MFSLMSRYLSRLLLSTLILLSQDPVNVLNGQDRSSRDNYTGDWELPDSWDPEWADPQTTFRGVKISINGYITANGPLTLFGNPTELIVNDTLVIKGDLTLGNNNNLTVNDNAILIIRGDLNFHNTSIITCNGYMIITGSIVRSEGDFNGSYLSNDDPVRLFVGGSAPQGVDGNPGYPVLSCSDPPTAPYGNSGCSYGNMADLMNDPVFDFFQSTCLIAAVTSNSPVCDGNAIELSVSAGIAWQWIGPSGFTSQEQHLTLDKAGPGMTGTYTATVTAGSGCQVIAMAEVMVDPNPLVIVTDPQPLCYPETADLTSPSVTAGSDTDLAWSWYTDPEGTIVMETPRMAGAGTWYIRGTSKHGCHSIKPVMVTINPTPLVIVTDPPLLCGPHTADLTDPAIVEGSDQDLGWSWHTDATGLGHMTSPGEAGAGTWYIRGTSHNGCYSIRPVTVTVRALPAVAITSSDSPLCAGDKRELAGTPAGGNFSIKDGPGYISGNMLTASGPGYIELEYRYYDGCENRALQTLHADSHPHPDQGPDQELEFIFNTKMQASLMPFETGKWSLISGSGRIGNPHSPQTEINNLSLGKNVFLWAVQNGSCIAGAEVKIIVNDLFVPSVITPNQDGRNDFFMISRVEGPVELIVFNKWGLEEYRNNNYRNSWDGRNNNGISLPEDTYFYILRFENGMTRQGTILIKR